MANIFQKMFLPRYQWMVLDFVDKNRKSIKYEYTENDFYTWRTLRAEYDGFSLNTTLKKNKENPDAPAFVSYSFVCTRHKSCDKDCNLKNNGGELNGKFADYEQSQYCERSEEANFAFRLYNKMFNYYSRENNKHCIACHAR